MRIWRKFAYYEYYVLLNRKYKNINNSPWIQTQRDTNIATIQETLANISKMCAFDP